MKEKDFNKGIDELKNIRLSKSEKESIFKNIMSAPVESPFVKRSPIFVSIFSRHTQIFVAASLVLVMSFGGAIYASDEALPGDILYPVKTVVVESVLGVVYSTPEKKLVWEEEKVERRITEAEKLIEKDDLDEEKLAKLEAKIEKSSISFAVTASLVASSSATSSYSKKERENKLKQEFRTRINERKIAFDDDEEVSDAGASATMMMSVPVSDEDRVLNELTNESPKRSGKNLNREKIERLKKAATRNLNGDHDDDDFSNELKLRGDGSIDDDDSSSSDELNLRGDRGENEDNDTPTDDGLKVEVDLKIEDIRI